MSAPFRRFGEPCRRQTGEKGNRFFAAGVGKAGEATTRMHGSDFPRACGVGASVPISRASGRNAGKEWCAPGVAFASRRMPTSPYSRHKLRRAAARADDERAAACPVRRLEAMPWPDFSHVFQGGRNGQADVSVMSRMNGISGIIRAVPRAGGLLRHGVCPLRRIPAIGCAGQWPVPMMNVQRLVRFVILRQWPWPEFSHVFPRPQERSG